MLGMDNQTVIEFKNAAFAKITADYHIHSKFSFDAEESLENIIEIAIQRGLEQICLTEHIDKIGALDIQAYFAEVERCQELFSGKIKILHGVELGVEPDYASLYHELVKWTPFDFVICSSHTVHKKDPYIPSYWMGRSEHEALEEYFQAILDNIRVFFDFDVYGHLDYAVRYAPTKSCNYKCSDYAEIIEQILRELIQAGKGIEVNTSGFRYGVNQSHPHFDILKRYRELGGEILTVGTDSHKAIHIANDYEMLADGLRNLGYKYYTVFEKRLPTFKPL